MPRSRNACTRFSVKCRPAVGAATEPSVVREHGLVVGAVALVDRAAAADIGRQRHVAALGQRVVERRAVKRERKGHLAALAFCLDRGVELFEEAHPAFGSEAHHVAGFEPLRRPHQRAPARAVETFGQRRRDGGLAIVGAAAAEPAAVQIRRHDLGVVDDQRIAAAQQRRQIADDAILALDRRARTHHEKPRGVARRRRPQRDAVLRQGKIEFVGAHGSSIWLVKLPAGGCFAYKGISQPFTRQSM